jgi:hypothetical protein
MRVVGLLAVVVAIAGSAAAEQLAAYPSAIQLDHQGDRPQLVVVGTQDDGVTVDRSAAAQATFAPEGIATLENGRLIPVSDGETTLTLQHGEATTTVPVVVKNAAVQPPVSFQNDIEAILLSAGCNAGSCHGSAQGKNGFHLSLFGYDPGLDHRELTRGEMGRRLNRAVPGESLALAKAAGSVDHEGGTRFHTDSDAYATMKRWVEEGAQNDGGNAPALTGIEMLPRAATLGGKDQTQQFVVRATYADGTDRDVTSLAILSSSDDLTLAMDEAGLSTGGLPGEVYVMARFGTFAVVSQAIVLDADRAFTWPEVQPVNYVDEMVFAKLRKMRVAPAELCSDEVFLRRVYIDIIGALPTVEESRAFLVDTAPDKRVKLIDTLLSRPQFSSVWAMKWADVLGVRSSQAVKPKGMHRYNDWLRGAIETNTPLDQLVRDLLSAQGGTFSEPAANYYVQETDPKIVAENVAQVFMGVQIKCAQCHNHPFERWTMDDYYSFAAFFAQIGRKAGSDPRETIIYDKKSGEVANLRDGQQMKPKFLGGETPDMQGRDRRAVLAEWLTSPENSWFAKNIANRVWEHCMGTGIIDPVDDVRVSNPPSNPELLDTLAIKLVENSYDLRALMRDICSSHVYQMKTTPRAPEYRDERNFANAKVRRLGAEQLLDAVTAVTESKVKFAGLPMGSRAIQVANANSGNVFLDLFGRPARETACVCERRGEPTLSQTLHLINGSTLDGAIKDGNGRLARLAAAETPSDQIMEELYLAALCRFPTDEEKQKLSEHIASAETPQLGMEDAFWSVLNAKEFVFNH